VRAVGSVPAEKNSAKRSSLEMSDDERDGWAREPEVFLDVPQVPVHVGVLWPSAREARECGRGDIRLSFDRTSGFIRNVAFNETFLDYTVRYDNALHFSPFFRRFEDELAHRLLERYDLRNKHVVEIGAGGGHFLGRLCELGQNRGTGYDPSFDPAGAHARLGERVRVVRDYYSERYADHPADLICCRHVLEHIPEPRHLLRTLRRALESRPETVVYFEVPNSYLILRDLSIWDVIYEHCGYFVPESLGAMFAASGFEILDLNETYEGQFVGIEACPGPMTRGGGERCDISVLAPSVAGFAHRFQATRAEWQGRLTELRRENRRSVVWGGGAKAVSFLNLLEIGDQIEYVVDVNPRKQGSYLAGSGQEIVAPEFLRKYQPDVAIVLNPVYRQEIEAQLAAVSPATRTVTAMAPQSNLQDLGC
jgi:SAM-dependent methyltransferase